MGKVLLYCISGGKCPGTEGMEAQYRSLGGWECNYGGWVVLIEGERGYYKRSVGGEYKGIGDYYKG